MKRIGKLVLAVLVGYFGVGFPVTVIVRLLMREPMSETLSGLILLVCTLLTVWLFSRKPRVRNDSVSPELRPGDPYFRHPRSS